MARLVDDLFEVARLQAGTIRFNTDRVGLADLVSDALATHDPVAKARGVKLMGRAETTGTVVGDNRELSRALGNLIVNAIRATPAGVALIAGAKSISLRTVEKARSTIKIPTPIELAPPVQRYVTLTCVSNEVGGDLVGNARWQGVLLKTLLDTVGVDPAADQVVGESVDGFTAAFPLQLAPERRNRSGRNLNRRGSVADNPTRRFHGHKNLAPTAMAVGSCAR